MRIRLAHSADLNALNALELQLFNEDRIPPRQMKRFLNSDQVKLFVAEVESALAGYAILLFNRGTQLSRVYSLAVDPEFRGRNMGRSLVEQCERAVLDQGSTILRLEVREDNPAAVKLYDNMGYETVRPLIHYYGYLCHGRRVQKRLIPQESKVLLPIPLYRSTSPFTGGAACLLMSFSCLDPSFQPTRPQELQLWRESTSTFMAAGQGGCSEQGLALAAARRGYRVALWSPASATASADKVRDQKKKHIIDWVHQDMAEQLGQQDVRLMQAPPSQAQLEAWVGQGDCVLLLISTHRFGYKKQPRWIVLSGVSEKFFFFHDPQAESEDHQAGVGHIPVGKAALSRVVGFAQQKQIACVVIAKPL